MTTQEDVNEAFARLAESTSKLHETFVVELARLAGHIGEIREELETIKQRLSDVEDEVA